MLGAAALLGVFAVLVGWAFRARAPRYSGDEAVWANVAHVPSWNELARGLRPPLVPLVYEALHHDPLLIVRAQLVVSVFAIAAFALALSAFLRDRRLRVVMCALVFVWGVLDPNDFSWSVRSESLAHSLMWLTLAGFLWFLRLELVESRGARWRWAAALGLLLGAALFSLTRDNAAYVVLGLGAALPVLLVRTEKPLLKRRGAGGVALGLILIGVLSTRATERSGRHVAPLANLLVARLSKSKKSLDYLERVHELPERERVVQVSKKGLSQARRVVLRSDEFEPLRRWLELRGPRAYRGLLLRSPVAAVREAAPWFPKLAAADYRAAYLADPAPAWSRARAWLWTLSPQRAAPGATAALAGLGAALLVGLGRRAALRSLGGFLGLLLVLAFGATFLAYHGDAMEIERHGALVGVLLRALVAVGLTLGVMGWSERALAGEAPSVSRSDEEEARAFGALCLWGAPTLGILLILLPFPSTAATVEFADSSPGSEALTVLRDGSIREGEVCLATGDELGFRALSSGKRSLRLFAALDRPHPGRFEVEVQTKRGKKLLRPKPFEEHLWNFYAAKLPSIRSGTIRAKDAPLCLTEIRVE